MTPYEALELLELAPDFTAEELKRNFRRKAMECHPDLFAGNLAAASPEAFLRIREAYELLSRQPGPIPAMMVETPPQANPFRSEVRLPDWAVLKDAENITLLWLSARKRKPRSGRRFSLVFRFNRTPLPQKPSALSVFISAWNLLKLLLASAFMAVIFLAGFLLLACFIPGVLLFLLLYRVARKYCVRLSGQLFAVPHEMRMRYLRQRMLMLVVLNGMACIPVVLLLWPTGYFWLRLPAVCGILVPVLLLHVSVLYEWLLLRKLRGNRT